MENPLSWKKYQLDELLEYEQPTPFIVESTDYNDAYPIPVLTAGKSFIIGKTNESTGIYTDLPVIIFDDFTTATQFVNFPFKVKSSAMKILSANTKLILPKFAYHLMQIIKCEHSTHKRYWIQEYSQIRVSVPPLHEQERIVVRIEELFSDLDKGVEALQTIKAQLKVYRQAVLKEAFEGKLEAGSSDAHEKLYLSLQQSRITLGNRNQYSLLEQIDMPDLPSEWHWVCVGDVISSCSYGTSSKSSGFGKVPVIRMGNLQNGVIDWDDLAYTSDEAEIEKYKLYPYDVLFNRTNSPEWVGKTAIYKGERPAIYAGYLIRINYLQGINPQYLAYFLNSPIARSYGKKVKTDGVNQSNINATKLCTYPFPLCGKKTQDKIVAEIESRLSVCDKIEQTVDESLAKAESLRQSILKKAFEGKL